MGLISGSQVKVRERKKPICDSCKYYATENKTSGYCMRYPPKVSAKPDGGIVQGRPYIKMDDFCGEHKGIFDD